MPKVKIQDIKVLNLQKGDTVFVRVNHNLSNNRVTELAKELKKYFGDNQFLIHRGEFEYSKEPFDAKKTK